MHSYVLKILCEPFFFCFNEDYSPSHGKGLYQSTSHSPCRTQALVSPVDLLTEITEERRLELVWGEEYKVAEKVEKNVRE